VFTSPSWRCSPSISEGVLPISSIVCKIEPVDLWPVSSISGSRDFFFLGPRLAPCVDTATVRSRGLSTRCCFLSLALPVTRPCVGSWLYFCGLISVPLPPLLLTESLPVAGVVSFWKPQLAGCCGKGCVCSQSEWRALPRFGGSLAVMPHQGSCGWRGAIANNHFGFFPALAAVQNHHIAMCFLDCF